MAMEMMKATNGKVFYPGFEKWMKSYESLLKDYKEKSALKKVNFEEQFSILADNGYVNK